jgi:hypothetical protein
MIALLVICQLCLTGCPGDDQCESYNGSDVIEDLLALTPSQNIYNQGDILTLKGFIPSVNNYFGTNEVNLFGQTNDNSALLIVSFSYLFTGNELTFIKGSQGGDTNWFEMPYNPNNGNYEFEVKVKLNKVGHYSLTNSGFVDFKGNTNCNSYSLNTTVSWIENTPIEFDVE